MVFSSKFYHTARRAASHFLTRIRLHQKLYKHSKRARLKQTFGTHTKFGFSLRTTTRAGDLITLQEIMRERAMRRAPLSLVKAILVLARRNTSRHAYVLRAYVSSFSTSLRHLAHFLVPSRTDMNFYLARGKSSVSFVSMYMSCG